MPNIAHYILNTEPFTSSIKLTGIAIGNACWGGNATHVECNGTVHCSALPTASTALGRCCGHCVHPARWVRIQWCMASPCRPLCAVRPI